MHLDVLRPDDGAQAVGTVVRTRTGFGLYRLDALGEGEGLVHWPSSALIPFSLANGGGAALVGTEGTVTGRWDGKGITEGSFDRSPLARPADVEITLRDEPGRKPLDPMQVERALPTTIELLQAGTLVSVVRDPYEVHVLAHDIPEVERALRPFYCGALVVRRSPYSRSDLQLVRNLWILADHEDVYKAFGGGLYHGENTTLLEVSYVTPAMQDLAKRIPDGALEVDAQARPVRHPAGDARAVLR